jgi:hypothetical protein
MGAVTVPVPMWRGRLPETAEETAERHALIKAHAAAQGRWLPEAARAPRLLAASRRGSEPREVPATDQAIAAAGLEPGNEPR